MIWWVFTKKWGKRNF